MFIWNVYNVTMFQGPGMVAAIWGIFYGEIRVIAIFEILRVDLRKFLLMNERFILLGKAELRHLSCRFCRHHYRGCTHGQIKDVKCMTQHLIDLFHSRMFQLFKININIGGYSVP